MALDDTEHSFPDDASTYEDALDDEGSRAEDVDLGQQPTSDAKPKHIAEILAPIVLAEFPELDDAYLEALVKLHYYRYEQDFVVNITLRILRHLGADYPRSSFVPATEKDTEPDHHEPPVLSNEETKVTAPTMSTPDPEPLPGRGRLESAQEWISFLVHRLKVGFRSTLAGIGYLWSLLCILALIFKAIYRGINYVYLTVAPILTTAKSTPISNMTPSTSESEANNRPELDDVKDHGVVEAEAIPQPSARSLVTEAPGAVERNDDPPAGLETVTVKIEQDQTIPALTLPLERLPSFLDDNQVHPPWQGAGEGFDDALISRYEVPEAPATTNDGVDTLEPSVNWPTAPVDRTYRAHTTSATPERSAGPSRGPRSATAPVTDTNQEPQLNLAEIKKEIVKARNNLKYAMDRVKEGNPKWDADMVAERQRTLVKWTTMRERAKVMALN
ncbi:hypothetical protein DFP72DRAFT_1163458 [Ephemerocybe angulata]|uniref:Uncharacterized protein n=1 Tax=Ephemerocybe angulata TaxID=980116 RepID=A0A8H6MFR9_9AGAR|nr:hypothetical protein DFP72DRAFT_1163458 [Tulosesus angulatus]